MRTNTAPDEHRTSATGIEMGARTAARATSERGSRLLHSLAVGSAVCLATAALAVLGPVPLALAETIGGEQLAQAGVQVNPGPDADPLPDIRAESWVIADADTGQILAAKNAHEQRAPASTLKTLTALTVLPRVPLDTVYRATTDDARTGGTRVGLIVGKPYTLEQLMYGMFLRSGNDAANAVANAAGGVRQTVRAMNDLAERMQALDTRAKTPNGLDTPGQVSSAYDLALFGRAGLARSDFATFAGTKSYDFPGKGKRTYPIYNTNRLLLSGFRGVTGVKTGYTSNAGRTYIGSAERRGHTIVVSMMGITDSTENAARTALQWGLRNTGKVTPVGQLVDPLPEPTPTPTATATPSAVALPVPATADDGPNPIGQTVEFVTAPTPFGPRWVPLCVGVALFTTAVGLLIAARVRRTRRRAPPRAAPQLAALTAGATANTVRRASMLAATAPPVEPDAWRPGRYRRLRKGKPAPRKRRAIRAFGIGAGSKVT